MPELTLPDAWVSSLVYYYDDQSPANSANFAFENTKSAGSHTVTLTVEFSTDGGTIYSPLP